MSEPARRETAKSTAQRTWSLVRGSWTVVEELPVVVVGASVMGRMAGKAMGFSRPDEVKSPADGLSSISMEATASTTSDSSAAIANLQVIKNQNSKIKIQNSKDEKAEIEKIFGISFRVRLGNQKMWRTWWTVKFFGREYIGRKRIILRLPGQKKGKARELLAVSWVVRQKIKE